MKFYVRHDFPCGLWYAVDEFYESEMIDGVVIANGFIGAGDTVQKALSDLLDKQWPDSSRRETASGEAPKNPLHFKYAKTNNNVPPPHLQLKLQKQQHLAQRWLLPAQVPAVAVQVLQSM